jgi:protein required for attachment to host cells
VVSALKRRVRAQKAPAIVVVAPRTLAELRNAFHPDVKSLVLAELHKDLTKHSVGEIEKHLTIED